MSVRITCIIFVLTLVKLLICDMSGFIVGGNYSQIEDFPYSVYISKNCSNRNSSCGASVLNQELLLSAAHCYYTCDVPFVVNAYTGSIEKFHGVETKVIDFKVHAGYNPDTKANDIALLKLEIPLTFGSTVKRVAVMKTPPEYEFAIIAGWGWIDSIGTRDSHLKHAHQIVMDNKECSAVVDAIPEGTICGRDKGGVSYPEKGDSGSALVIHNLIQIGLVSFKKRAYTNDTIIYTYVPYFYDWILENANELLCSNDTDIETLRNHTTTPSSGVVSSLHKLI